MEMTRRLTVSISSLTAQLEGVARFRMIRLVPESKNDLQKLAWYLVCFKDLSGPRHADV